MERRRLNIPKLIAFLATSLFFMLTSNVLKLSSTSIGMPVGRFLAVQILLAIYVFCETRQGMAARITTVLLAFGGTFVFFLAALIMAYTYRAHMVLTLASLTTLEIGIYQIVMIVVGEVKTMRAKWPR